MMKKMMIFLLLLASTLGGKSQKLIGTTGAGIFQSGTGTEEIDGNYEFVEGRLMFGEKFRVGLMANYTWVYLIQDQADPFHFKGRAYSLGLSVDKWWNTTNTNNYFWINSGLRWSYDRGATTNYHSWQKDQFFLFQGGLRSTRIFNDWFGNSLAMIEWQMPIKDADARYSVTPGIVRKGDPYDKGNVRLTYENGIRKIPFSIKFTDFYLEPAIHIGGGLEDPSYQPFFEYGGGFSVGYARSDGWDRELFKIKAFGRQDFKGYDPKSNDDSKPNSLHIELTINLLNFKKN